MMLKSKMRARMNGEHASGSTSSIINTLYSSGPFLVETKKHNRRAAEEEKAKRQENSSPPHSSQTIFPTTSTLPIPTLSSIQKFQQYADTPQWWQIIFNLNAPIQYINMNGKNGKSLSQKRSENEYEIYQTKKSGTKVLLL